MTDYEAIIKEMIDAAQYRLDRDRDNLNKALEEHGDNTSGLVIDYFAKGITSAESEIQTLQKVLRRGEGFD